MGKDRITKRIYVGECKRSHVVDRPRKRWIDSAKDCLKKRSPYVGQARRMVYDGNERREFCEGGMFGAYPGR